MCTTSGSCTVLFVSKVFSPHFALRGGDWGLKRSRRNYSPITFWHTYLEVILRLKNPLLFNAYVTMMTFFLFLSWTDYYVKSILRIRQTLGPCRESHNKLLTFTTILILHTYKWKKQIATSERIQTKLSFAPSCTFCDSNSCLQTECTLKVTLKGSDSLSIRDGSKTWSLSLPAHQLDNRSRISFSDKVQVSFSIK